MKVLVTGAGGFLGQRIARSLLLQGVDDLRLHVRQRPPEGLVEELRAAFPQARIEWAGANLLARDALASLVADVDCLVHAAAGMRGAAADMFANSVVGTRNLLEAAGAAGVRRVVQISSFAVYRTETLGRNAVHDESVPLETVGVDKGPYGYAKVRQEQLLDEYRARFGFETVVLRPGVIYGEGGGALSPRVGIGAMGLFFSLGGGATLPLTYVENCADAVAVAALKAPPGSAFNVVDDDLPSCRRYLREYRRLVRRLRTIPVPYPMLLQGSRMLVWYHRRSKGQLPAVFTPYVVRSMYRPLRYANAALKQIGWSPRVTTQAGLERTFRYLHGKG
ncbi:NAD-dependent epimerase/dehydratase family protein [Pseudoxanthomonas japonensis]|jgi:nucleoside-diphosphate-sugar epimerase|uniref:NAD-dependent epimerase/dehydratase family protein n=1 Tax=Pseudoxanthomonas japonensis TaxID=69284 RepID=UPI001BCEF60C|nr:NAD(P)-dependent oxidoreductase [Pseudoxanthomonas japonensis]